MMNQRLIHQLFSLVEIRHESKNILSIIQFHMMIGNKIPLELDAL